MSYNEIFEKQSKLDNDTFQAQKARLLRVEIRQDYSTHLIGNFNKKKSNPVSKQIELVKFNQKTLELVYNNYDSPKEALYQRRYELPVETLSTTVGQRKKNMAHKLLEWQKRGQFKDAPNVEPDAVDIISRFADQCAYRIERTNNAELLINMQGGMEVLVREAISLKVLTEQQLEHAINKGVINYDQLKQFAKEGILRKEQLNANIKVEYTDFDGTTKQMEGKLYQHLMREDDLMVKGRKTFTKWMDKKHSKISTTSKDLRQDFVQFSIDLELQGIDTKKEISLQEMIKYTTPANQVKVGEILKNRIERANDLDQTFNMMSDLIKYHHKSKGSKADAISAVFAKCQEAIYKGDIKDVEIAKAQATFNRAMEYHSKHPNVMRYAMKHSPVTRGTMNGPGDETLTQSKVMLAALSMPCEQLSKNFDKLTYLAPSQDQFKNRSVFRIGWDNVCKGLSSIEKSGRVEHFNKFMKEGEAEIQAAGQVQVAPSQTEEVKKPVHTPPTPPKTFTLPDRTEIPMPPSHKPPVPPSHKPPAPGMAWVKASVKQINNTVDEKVKGQAENLDAKEAVMGQSQDRGKGGGRGGK